MKRFPISNDLKNKNWKKVVERYKLDPTLNWKFARIISTENVQKDF